MRLIDVDKFKKFISELPNGENGYSQVYDKSSILDFIDDQPTAYDVEKVIERLEKTRDTISQNIALNSQEDNIDEEILNKISQYQKIIQIVKSGGIMKSPSPDPSGHQRGTPLMPPAYPLVFQAD